MVLPRLGSSPRNARRPNPAPRGTKCYSEHTPVRLHGEGIWGTGCLNYFIHRCSSTQMIIRTHKAYKKHPWMFFNSMFCIQPYQTTWPAALHKFLEISYRMLLVCTCFHNQTFCWFLWFYFIFLPVLWTTNSGIVYRSKYTGSGMVYCCFFK